MNQSQSLPVFQFSLFFSPCLLGHLGESRTFSPASWVPARLCVQPFRQNGRRRRGGHRAQGLRAALAGSRGITHGRVAAAGSTHHTPPGGSGFTHPCSPPVPLNLHPGYISLTQMHSGVKWASSLEMGSSFQVKHSPAKSKRSAWCGLMWCKQPFISPGIS